MTEFNPMQQVKRAFFAMRNGITADVLRRAGSPFPMIFGLNLPQIREVADAHGKDVELARTLRDDRRTRESQLLAPMLFPPEALGPEEALGWIEELPEATEVADVLCHRLLRHLQFAPMLAKRAGESPRASTRYTALRLAVNLQDETLIRELADLKSPLLAPLSRQALADLELY